MSLSNEHVAYSYAIAFFTAATLAHGRRALPICLPDPTARNVFVQRDAVVSEGFTQPPEKQHTKAMGLSRLKSGPSEPTAYAALEPRSLTCWPPVEIKDPLDVCSDGRYGSAQHQLSDSLLRQQYRAPQCVFLQGITYVRPVI